MTLWPELIYLRGCPNCWSEVKAERLCQGLLCERCLPEGKSICEARELKHLTALCLAQRLLEEFESFCKNRGFPLLSLQRVWAKRVLRGHSFSIVAPTGIGKSTFGMLISAFLAEKGKKTYIVLPTSVLVKQTLERLLSLTKARVLGYYSQMEDAQGAKARILAGEFDILVTTSNFLSKNALPHTFDFIFVDDVDAFLKASRNIEKSLRLLGFPQELLSLAREMLIRKAKGQSVEGLEERFKSLFPSQHGVLVVSSATAKPRGLNPKLYRLLLGFDIGIGRAKVRDVLDLHYPSRDLDSLVSLVERLGSGGLIFAKTESEAERIVEKLRSVGLSSALASSKHKESIDAFLKGELDLLVGVASYYGVLVRGLDYPERIRYAVFFGLPVFRTTPERFFGLALSDVEQVKQELARRGIRGCLVREQDGEVFIVFPDVKTYIQASGRTSRLTPLGLSKGLSILMEEDERLVSLLNHYLLLSYDVRIKRWDEVGVEEVLKAIDADRARLREARGKAAPDVIKTLLMIVESPNKARTISFFFGRPAVRRLGHIRAYEVSVGKCNLIVASSGGHMLDLVTKGGFYGVRLENKRFVPVYDTIKRAGERQFVDELSFEGCVDAIERLHALQELAWECDGVLLATDIDTEGEKISFDLFAHLRPFNTNLVRTGFNEITRRAVLRALENFAGQVDLNKVKAQLVRRVEDRWIGFALSERVQRAFGNKRLSTGRVQTPVLGWIIQRYREFKQRATFVELTLEGGLRLAGFSERVPESAVLEVKKEERTLNPLPPFTTETLIEEANHRLGFDSEKTMRLAQELFELALTTYHRTSSTRVSLDGRMVAKDYLVLRGLEHLNEPREFFMEGAHECIRPTKPMDVEELRTFVQENNLSLSRDHFRLYGLIFRRFLASQVKPARVLWLKVKELNSALEKEGIGEVLEEGWMRFYPSPYPKIAPVQPGPCGIVEAKKRKMPKAPLFDDGSLVKEMKSRGIGRPSTYFQIIKKLLDRHYVIRSKRRNKLIPTKLGEQIYAYLSSSFREFICEERTRELEELMDRIEQGELDYQEVLNQLYQEIAKLPKG